MKIEGKKLLVLLLSVTVVIVSFGLSRSQADDDTGDSKSIKEFKTSVSPEEYERRYKEFYGNFTEQMAEEGNPADFMVDDGKALFNKVAGTKGKVMCKLPQGQREGPCRSSYEI
ncbi:MAG TPA: hypothetical protein ENH50_03895, partial [Nitrospirae bacterium]|nr:hypothetical protein [Nitrospirota bacterium]